MQSIIQPEAELSHNPMSTSTENKAIDETLLSSIGESYEYLNVIVRNKLEIKKLESLRFVRVAAGKLVFGLVLLTIAFFISLLFVTLMAYGFYILLNSLPFAILATIGSLMLLCLILYMLRNVLFYKTCQRKIDKMSKLVS